MIPRCCKDTLAWRLGSLNGPFVEGTEIPCRWCEGLWIFREGAWRHRDALAQQVDRMVAELPAVRARIEDERTKRAARERC